MGQIKIVVDDTSVHGMSHDDHAKHRVSIVNLTKEEVEYYRDILAAHLTKTVIPKRVEYTDRIYTKNDVDFAYLIGVLNCSGMDGLSNELSRLTSLGKHPHDIIDSTKHNTENVDYDIF